MKKTQIKLVAFILLLAVACQPEKPETLPSLIHSSWKLMGYFNLNNEVLQIFEPMDCEECYTFTFDTDSTAKGITTGNYLHVNLSSERLIWVPTAAMELGDGFLFTEIISNVNSYIYDSSGLKFICEDRSYIQFERR